MATRRIQDLENVEEVLADSIIPVGEATKTKSMLVSQLKNWLSGFFVGLSGDQTIDGNKKLQALIMRAISATKGGEIIFEKNTGGNISDVRLDVANNLFRIFATNSSGNTVVPLQVDFNNSCLLAITPSSATDNTTKVATTAWVNSRLGGTGITSTEIGYLNGVTSAIQTQLNGKIPNPSGSNTNFKIACSNNFKIQGGIVTTATNTNYYTVTFPTAFTSQPVLLTRYLATQGRGYEGTSAVSNTGFTTYVTSASASFHQNGKGVAWIAYGI